MISEQLRSHRLRLVEEHNEKAGGYCTCGSCYSQRVIAAGYVWRAGRMEYTWSGYNTSTVVARAS